MHASCIAGAWISRHASVCASSNTPAPDASEKTAWPYLTDEQRQNVVLQEVISVLLPTSVQYFKKKKTYSHQNIFLFKFCFFAKMVSMNNGSSALLSFFPHVDLETIELVGCIQILSNKII